MRTRYNIHITNPSDIDILDVDLMQAGAIQTLIILLKDNHNIDIEYDIIDSESDEPNGQDPDGTTDLGLEPLEEEWNDDEPIQTEAYQDIDPDSTYGNYPYDIEFFDEDKLIEETDYLEEDDE